ncbi:MAG: hypothetical protein JXA62_03410, partial [Candidatus Aminicenantes bacterium]|nr:hypothetical protein [Candidatus Aminicenantes bacterium]
MSTHKGKIGIGMAVLFMVCSTMTVAQNSADLTARISCPGIASAGQELGKTIQVTVKNLGQVTAARFAVDLVLSTDTAVPVKYASYSANFQEDCLLQGGREHEFNLAGGETRIVTLNGNNRIPADTPPGTYYLAAVIDAGDEVSESNERNNVVLCRLKIGEELKQTITPVLRPHVVTHLKVPVP